MGHAHRVRAALSLTALAACSLGVRLPEGRITCAADTDCPPDWVCRLPEAGSAGLCYRSAAERDAGAGADTGDANGSDGQTLPPTQDASAEPDAADSDPGNADGADAGTGDAASAADARVGAPPTVSALTLTRTVFNSGESVQVTCLASDPDDDTLTYSWSSAGGSFDTPTQRSTLFTTGPVGPVSLTCAVDDGHGNTAEASTEVRVYPTDLVTYLPFSLGAGSADASGHGRSGAVYNGVYVADRTGAAGAALELSGAGAVTLADPAAFAVPSWSFVTTLRPAAGGGGTLMGKASGSGFGSYGLFVYSDGDPSLPGRIQYYQQAGSGGAPYVVVLGSYAARGGVFFQLAVTRSAAGELHAYVDGAEIAVQRGLPAAVVNDAPLVLGSGVFGPFTGVIDEVQFYARVLDASEVAKLAELP